MTPIGSPSHSRATYKGERLSVWFLVSLIPFGLSVVLFAASYALDPTKTRISFGDNFHVSLLVRGDIDARIVFFNNAEDGPYQGGMLSLSSIADNGSSNATASALEPKVSGFGDCFGIYYRYIHWPDAVLWTLELSLWYPLTLFSVFTLVAFWIWKRRRAREEAGGA